MKVGDWCEQWMTACQESPDGSTTIDLSQVFEQIFTRNMIHISTGQELSKEQVEIWDMQDVAGNLPMIKRTLELSVALTNVTHQMAFTAKLKMNNPLYRICLKIFGWNLSLTTFEKQIDENYVTLRSFIRKFIQERKTGKTKSQVENDADLLSLFLQAPDIFKDEDIIDEMVDLFLAGSQTTKLSAQTIMGHFSTDPESVKRVRDEFKKAVEDNDIMYARFNNMKDYLA